MKSIATTRELQEKPLGYLSLPKLHLWDSAFKIELDSRRKTQLRT